MGIYWLEHNMQPSELIHSHLECYQSSLIESRLKGAKTTQGIYEHPANLI